MKKTFDKKVVAIDFDGTITEPSPYPITGKIRKEAIRVIKKLQEKYILVLWTCRKGNDLKEAIKLLEENGIRFEWINKSPYGGYPKIRADYYIDDKCLHYIDWDFVESKLIG